MKKNNVGQNCNRILELAEIGRKASLKESVYNNLSEFKNLSEDAIPPKPEHTVTTDYFGYAVKESDLAEFNKLMLHTMINFSTENLAMMEGKYNGLISSSVALSKEDKERLEKILLWPKYVESIKSAMKNVVFYRFAFIQNSDKESFKELLSKMGYDNYDIRADYETYKAYISGKANEYNKIRSEFKTVVIPNESAPDYSDVPSIQIAPFVNDRHQSR